MPTTPSRDAPPDPPIPPRPASLRAGRKRLMLPPPFVFRKPWPGGPDTRCAACDRKPSNQVGFVCISPKSEPKPEAIPKPETGADLTGKDFWNAELDGHLFGTSDLKNCRLQDANLTGADLSEVKNLLPEQVSGADLTGAILSTEMKAFDALTHVKDLSENAGKLLVSLLAACAFMLLTLARLTDVQILIGSATAKLPIIDTEISVRLFFLFGPLIILGLYFAFHLYLQRLWETLATLPAIFPDGVALDRKSYPWLVNDLVREHFLRLKEARLRTPLMSFQEALWKAVVYWLPPLLLLPFWARYLVCRSTWITTQQILMFTVALWSAFVFRHLATITLERDQTRICAWQNRWLFLQVDWLSRGVLIPFASALTLALFSWGAFEGLPAEAPVHGVVQNLRKVPPRILDWTHASAFARLQDLRPAAQHTEAGDGRAADLRGLDLRYARAEGASLAGADLREANLRGADLQDTDLTGANLDGADLTGAILDSTNHKKARYWFLARYNEEQRRDLGLPPAHRHNMDTIRSERARKRSRSADVHYPLANYDLAGTDLTRIALRNADLRSAGLQHTVLQDADLRGADLSGAKLQEADLSRAQLKGATLRDADVQGAHLESAFLTDPRGAPDIQRIMAARNWILAHYNAQQLSALQLENDHDTNLKSGSFRNLTFAGMDLHGSNLIRFHLENAVLYRAHLDGAHLKAAFLTGIRAREAFFIGADLSEADLRGAHLEGATLTGAHLEGANVTGASLTGAVVRGAVYDQNTRWPPGYAALHPEMRKTATPAP